MQSTFPNVFCLSQVVCNGNFIRVSVSVHACALNVHVCACVNDKESENASAFMPLLSDENRS